jgi:hypothetical protein
MQLAAAGIYYTQTRFATGLPLLLSLLNEHATRSVGAFKLDVSTFQELVFALYTVQLLTPRFGSIASVRFLFNLKNELAFA